MRRTFAARNRKYISRDVRRFRCPFASSTQGSRVLLLGSFFILLPLLPSTLSFFSFTPGLSSQVVRTNLDREIRKSRDPEMYVCVTYSRRFAAIRGIPAVCSRLSNLSGVLVALCNRFVSVRYFLAFFENRARFFF